MLLGMDAKFCRMMPHTRLEMDAKLKHVLFLVCLTANIVSVALKKGLAEQFLI